MHAPETRAAALQLVAEGVNDCEIARRLGIPRATIRDWRTPRYVPRVEIPRQTCPRCWRTAKAMAFSDDDYALLLGLYLGDGCISRMGRTYRLRIHLDTKYPGIVRAAEELLARCFPHAASSTQIKDDGSCAVVGVYCNHLPCLFPQHGAGRKHERLIALEPWQHQIAMSAPWSLLRGLIWSDGCSFVNRHGKYEDLCFAFANRSTDLLDLFASTCDHLGLLYRRYPPRQDGERVRVGQVRINRREPVGQLLKHVGIKR
jgi:hypothetical protein